MIAAMDKLQGQVEELEQTECDNHHQLEFALLTVLTSELLLPRAQHVAVFRTLLALNPSFPR